MSVLSSVILTASPSESVEREDGTDAWPALDALNASMADEHWGARAFVPVEASAGSKTLCELVCVGCFNYLNLERFLELVAAAPWKYPEEVRVFVTDEREYEFGFTLVYPRDAKEAT